MDGSLSETDSYSYKAVKNGYSPTFSPELVSSITSATSSYGYSYGTDINKPACYCNLAVIST